MSPTAKELTGSNLVPEETKFVISKDGARRINEDLGYTSVQPGKVLTYFSTNQERTGGPPIYTYEKGGGISIDHDMDVFESCHNLPEWYDPKDFE